MKRKSKIWKNIRGREEADEKKECIGGTQTGRFRRE
jgi:hypothetical protein